jgi:hypothetical protein
MLKFEWGEFKCHKKRVEICVEVNIDKSKYMNMTQSQYHNVIYCVCDKSFKLGFGNNNNKSDL